MEDRSQKAPRAKVGWGQGHSVSPGVTAEEEKRKTDLGGWRQAQGLMAQTAVSFIQD